MQRTVIDFLPSPDGPPVRPPVSDRGIPGLATLAARADTLHAAQLPGTTVGYVHRQRQSGTWNVEGLAQVVQADYNPAAPLEGQIHHLLSTLPRHITTAHVTITEEPERGRRALQVWAYQPVGS